MKNQNPKLKIQNTKQGYLLLFAVVLSSIVLSIGLGIVNIVDKSLVLASAGRSSQLAFHAADGGAECALYWDRVYGGFSTTVFATSTFSVSPQSGVVCASTDIAETWSISGQTADAAYTVFDIAFDDGTCAAMTVSKTNGGLVTNIEAFGYNTCNESNPRRIERAIRIRY